MHQIIEMEQIEGRDGGCREQWTCECGRRGSGASRKTAVDGWKRHARAANRKEYYG